MAKPSPWGKQKYPIQYYELKTYNDMKRLLTLWFEDRDEKAKETAITRRDLLAEAMSDPNDKYRTWVKQLLETLPSVEHKITPGTPDWICQICQQNWGGTCVAMQMPHSDEERAAREGPYGMECDEERLKDIRYRNFGLMYRTPPGLYDKPNPNPKHPRPA